MYVAKNYSQIEQYIMKQLEESMRLLANDVKSIVKDYIYKNLYLTYSPHEYQRTGNFLESLDVKVKRKGNQIEAEIFFNTDFMEMNYMEDSYWNQHMSVDGSETWKGDKISNWIPVFLEYGVKNSLWDRDGIRSMENIQEYLETTKYHLKQIIALLKSKGIVAKMI
jgi:hypothetical protein